MLAAHVAGLGAQAEVRYPLLPAHPEDGAVHGGGLPGAAPLQADGRGLGSRGLRAVQADRGAGIGGGSAAAQDHRAALDRADRAGRREAGRRLDRLDGLNGPDRLNRLNRLRRTDRTDRLNRLNRLHGLHRMRRLDRLDRLNGLDGSHRLDRLGRFSGGHRLDRCLPGGELAELAVELLQGEIALVDGVQQDGDVAAVLIGGEGGVLQQVPEEGSGRGLLDLSAQHRQVGHPGLPGEGIQEDPVPAQDDTLRVQEVIPALQRRAAEAGEEGQELLPGDGAAPAAHQRRQGRDPEADHLAAIRPDAAHRQDAGDLVVAEHAHGQGVQGLLPVQAIGHESAQRLVLETEFTHVLPPCFIGLGMGLTARSRTRRDPPPLAGHPRRSSCRRSRGRSPGRRPDGQ